MNRPDGRSGEQAGAPGLLRNRWYLAGLAVLLAVLCQAAIVYSRYDGNWTALFYSGTHFRLPPELKAATYQHRDSNGYDGQFYRLTAHDPLGLKGYSEYYDSPSYRRRRIAVPALAWFLGLGQTRLIDWAYLATVQLLIASGVVLLSRLAEGYGRHPAWGAAFLFYPATLSGVARMLPDLALGLSILGYLLWRREHKTWAWLLLAFGCLTRELGLLIVAAAVCHEIRHRGWTFALLWASAPLPAIAWWASLISSGVAGGGAGVSRWLGRHAFIGFFERMTWTAHYTDVDWVNLGFHVADVAAMAGLAAAGVAAVWCWWNNRDGELEWLALAAASLAVIAAHPVFLRDECSTSRAYSLLTGPLALMSLKGRNPWLAVPLGLLALRLALGILGVLAVNFLS